MIVSVSPDDPGIRTMKRHLFHGVIMSAEISKLEPTARKRKGK